MTEKKTQPGQEAAAEVRQETKQAARAQRQQVYCGPSVKGVARQYTVYTGAVPAALEAFIQEHPAARGLLVSVERFAEVRKNLETSGTAEAILFQKIKADL